MTGGHPMPTLTAEKLPEVVPGGWPAIRLVITVLPSVIFMPTWRLEMAAPEGWSDSSIQPSDVGESREKAQYNQNILRAVVRHIRCSITGLLLNVAETTETRTGSNI